MASSKEYLEFILEQLAESDEVTYRPMMGEYVLYLRGKVVGGIYDDRLLVKPTKSALNMLTEVSLDIPYEGGKEMILADVEDRRLLAALLNAVADDLPPSKKK